MIRCNLQKSKDSGLYYLLSQLKIHHFKALKWYGPTGDNGFDRTTKKSSVIGTCAHFSSMTRIENRIIYRNPPSQYNGIAKEDFCYER